MTLKIVGFGVLGAVTAYILSASGFAGKKVYSALILCLFGIYFLDAFGEMIFKISDLDISESSSDTLKSALKILGMSHAFSYGAMVAGELSENGIADMLLLLGKIEMLAIAFPYFLEIINLTKNLIYSI